MHARLHAVKNLSIYLLRVCFQNGIAGKFWILEVPLMSQLCEARLTAPGRPVALAGFGGCTQRQTGKAGIG